MQKIDTVLFDFDGTIMNTNDVILMSWQHTFRTLANREEDEAVLTATFGEPLETTMRRFFPDRPLEEPIEIYRTFQRDNFNGLVALFPGIKELIVALKDQGYKVGLVTSRLYQTSMEGLDKYQLTKYFDAIVTMENTTKHKPDPEPVNIALEKLDARPKQAVMLGDTLFDILCARNAGVRSVLVAWSLALAGKTKADLGKDAPDHIIHKPEDLFAILESAE